MSDRRLGRALDEAIGKIGVEAGKIDAKAGGAEAEVDIVDVDRLGIRVRGVRVKRAEPIDVATAANELPDRLRSLPDRVEPVEIAPELGGAILRTVPEEIRDREFFEVDVKGAGDVEVKRLRATETGREPTDWTMTRRQLEKLIDEMDA